MLAQIRRWSTQGWPGNESNLNSKNRGDELSVQLSDQALLFMQVFLENLHEDHFTEETQPSYPRIVAQSVFRYRNMC